MHPPPPDLTAWYPNASKLSVDASNINGRTQMKGASRKNGARVCMIFPTSASTCSNGRVSRSNLACNFDERKDGRTYSLNQARPWRKVDAVQTPPSKKADSFSINVCAISTVGMRPNVFGTCKELFKPMGPKVLSVYLIHIYNSPVNNLWFVDKYLSPKFGDDLLNGFRKRFYRLTNNSQTTTTDVSTMTKISASLH